MKYIKIILVLFLLVGLSSCQKKQEAPKSAAANLPAGTHAVKVIDFIDVPSYTYIQVSENGNSYWLAAPQTKVEKGQTIYYSQGMEMKNFHSQTINRTFDVIYFVQGVSTQPAGQSLESIHQQAANSEKENISVVPLKDGKTISQIFGDKNALAGKIVKIKGQVTKYNPNIMGRNWIHIQDGTSSSGNFDLLVTSKDEASVGQTIVVEGKVAVNKDFGAGYSYTVMIEDAKIIPALH